MNKQQLVENLMEKTNVTKAAAEKFIDAFTETVSCALADGDKVQLVGFGTFEIRKKAARTARNPQTGETLNIPARLSPAFKPGKALKDKVNK